MATKTSAAVTVVIVDDDVDTTQSLHWLLELSGYTVYSVNSAEACLALVDRIAPDIMLLDLRMPHTSGFDLHLRLKAHPSCRATRFVAFSGMGEAATVRRMEEAGFDGNLLKPSDHKDVLKLIETVVSGQPSRVDQ